MTPAAMCLERPQSGPPAVQEDELEIQMRIDTLCEAICNKNLDGLMSHYLPDAVIYDLLPPLDLRGAAACRRNFEKWFASMTGCIHYEMLDVEIAAGDTHAFCHCLSHVTGARTGGGRADYWTRVSSGWRKVNGEWRIAHEHISMPTMM